MGMKVDKLRSKSTQSLSKVSHHTQASAQSGSKGNIPKGNVFTNGRVNQMGNTNSSNLFRSTITQNWEAQLMNDREYYATSPVAKFTQARGDLDSTQYLSRTFNRRLKMRDTFTNVIPLYNHEANTCYKPTHSHTTHERFHTSVDAQPAYKVNKKYFHKMDRIKDYSEEMLNLGVFAPQPRKAATKQQ